MSIEDTFGNLFKPEVKSSGRKLFAQEKVSLSTKSDTAIQAYVRVAPPAKVSLASDDISSSSFTADCSCPVAKKNRFCKHIWATLLCVEESYPDFLSEKIEINKTDSSSQTTGKSTYQESAKLKASDYRKAQYQKQKLHAKEQKRERKGLGTTPTLQSYPAEVETALAYFSQNGFPMPAGPSKDILVEAKRKLSRLFHPDKGGSHEESVELNQNCEAILQFFRGSL